MPGVRLFEERAEHRMPVIVFGVSPRRLYCELRDYRVFITLNDLSQARAAQLGSARLWRECFWARTTIREAARREGTLGTTGFDYSGPRRSHEGALEQQVSNTYTASIYKPT